MGACTWRVCALRRWISQQGRASSRGTDWSVPETFKEPKNGHAASLPRSTYFHSKNIRTTSVQTRERGRMRKLTLYRDDSTTQVVFEDVKHFFWTANNSVLTIAQITNKETGEHRYIHWPRERFCWYRDEPFGGSR